MIKKILTKLRDFWLAPLRSDMCSKLDILRSDICSKHDFLRLDMNSKLDSLRSDMCSKHDLLRLDMNSKLDSLRSDMCSKHDLLRDLIAIYICDRCNDQEYENKRRFDDPLHLDRYGYKVYSQNDEDGIIQEIFKRIGTTNKVFVEFGVQNGLESNCHFLLFNGWRGLWIDGDKNCFNELQNCFAKPISTKQLTAINAFITTDNINSLIGEDGGITGEIDLLSIDVDGNDYWIWEKISCIEPRVVVIEHNAKFPPPCEWVMEYDPNHVWDGSDKHGASLKSLELLGSRLGYNLVGTNKNGVNAFFVKRDLCKGLFAEPATAENLYHSWKTYYLNSGHTAKKYIGNT